MNKKYFSTLLKNTFIVMGTGLIVKLIGLFGKIMTTRILGIEGMSLYVLSYPTLLLFINISGFSLNTTISKLTSEAIATKKYSPKKILYNGIKLSLLISLICGVIYLLTIRTISNSFLKNDNLFFPLLSGIFLIFLVGISDGLRGYYNGIKHMKTASLSLLIEQITRTFFSLLFVIISYKKNIIVANCLLFIALALGEIVSITFCLIKMRKDKIISYPNTTGEKSIVWKISSMLTFSRLIGSFTYFLEPIIYTFVLTKSGLSTTNIHNSYTLIDALIFPFLTLISFIPFSLSTSIIPHISESFALNDNEKLNYYLHKVFMFTLIPSIIAMIIIYFYSSELMMLLYKTNEGYLITRQCCFYFILYYLQIVIGSIIQALGKVKFLFFNSCLLNILRLILIAILSLIPKISTNSLIYASIITFSISLISLGAYLFKSTLYKPKLNNLLLIIIFFLFNFSSLKFLTIFEVNYLLSIIILVIINLILIVKNKKDF